MSGGDQPNLDEIEAWFAAVADGRVSRGAADSWGGRWLLDEEREWDDLSLWALDLLCGIDLTAGSGGPYLHDDEQVRGWLEELRRRRAGHPYGASGGRYWRIRNR